MTYSVHFGWFDIGEAEVWIDPEIFYENNEAHYLVRCTIISSPWFRLFKQMDMCFESLIRVDDLTPLKSFRDLRQGKKIDVRHDNFDYGDSISVEAYIEDIDTHRYHKFPKSGAPLLDGLSTYLYLRSENLPALNDDLGVRTFFTNSLYEFYISPQKKGRFNLNGKKIPTAEFKLIFPPSTLTPKGKSGYAVVSADERRIPLKFKVNLSLGSFSLVLEDIQYE